MCTSGENLAHAPVHWDPIGVSDLVVGGHVNLRVARLPLRPHPHRAREDVPLAPDLYHAGDAVCESLKRATIWGQCQSKCNGV